jgi:hypothetical protein
MLTILALVASVLVQAGAPATRPPEGGTTIYLDFLATGEDGQSVPDLTAPDVTLKIDGKVRPLQSLELVEAEGSRNILLLMDEATLFGLEQVAKDAVARLLTSLRPGDRIAYVSTRRGRVSTLTANHQTATDAAQSMLAGPGVLWTCLTDMITSLGSLTRTLPTGRATSLIVLSRGSPYDGAFGSEGGGGCSPRSSLMRQLNETVSIAQINVHLLTVDHTNRSWGLDSLARNIGAGTGLLTWADAGGLERAVATAARFYRATFAVDSKANDRPQRVELRVHRPAVKVETSPRIRIDPGVVLKNSK